jgi:ribosomal protein S18 acetylase RimI-like enzyme
LKIEFIKVDDNEEKSNLCRKVLDDLPLWFGIPESNDEYCKGVKKHKLIKICYDNEDIGFASIKINNELVAEIYVMGILTKYHRNNIGTKLIEYVESDLRKHGFQYLEVKTLDESKESEEYRRTRLFYEKAGFIPFDVLYNEWGSDNPCLIMMKKL